MTVSAGFSDPGVLDHQAATLAWGDGSIEPQTAFTTFDEAFGDGTGAVSHTHRYTLTGSYPIALSVTDDDGGVDTESTVVRVVTPEQAVEEIIGLLDSAIAVTTDRNVRKDLEKARKALAGSTGQSNDGALNMITAGNEDGERPYPCQVLPVTRGERLAVVAWIQSHVRDPGTREALWDLAQARELIRAQYGKGRVFDLVNKAHANLLRRWSEP